MTKAQAWAQWTATVWRAKGRYWTLENGRAVRATSWAVFWKTVQRYNRLAASDPGGNIRL